MRTLKTWNPLESSSTKKIGLVLIAGAFAIYKIGSSDTVPSPLNLSHQAIERLLKFTGPGLGNSTAIDATQLSADLKTAHPQDVTLADIEARVAFQENLRIRRHLLEGLIFPSLVKYEDGKEVYYTNAVADDALYNGIHLAGLIFKYKTTWDSKTLREIAAITDGLYKLTHINGKIPGLMGRYALPLEEAKRSHAIRGPNEESVEWHHIYYSDPSHVEYINEEEMKYGYLEPQIAGLNGVIKVEVSPAGRALDPSRIYYGDQYYHTRASRDQTTGIVLGLAAATYFFENRFINPIKGKIPQSDYQLIQAIRETAHATAIDMYLYLNNHDWKWQDVDPNKTKNKANNVTSTLKMAMNMLYRRVLMNTYPSDPAKLGPWRVYANLLRKQSSSMLDPYLDRTILLELKKELEEETGEFTPDPFAWNLRTMRLFPLIILDDIHPDFQRVAAQEGWHEKKLTLQKVNGRNRHVLSYWDHAVWTHVHGMANPWFTYLFNYARRLVAERHIPSLESYLKGKNGLSIYNMTQDHLKEAYENAGFNTGSQEYKGLEEVLYTKIKKIEGGHPRLGLMLPINHFNLKSTAISAFRYHAPGCSGLVDTDKCLVKNFNKERHEFYPIHLMKHADWIFEKSGEEEPPQNAIASPTQTEEAPLISLPTVYWLGKASGQLDAEFGAYDPRWFTPPGSK